MAADATYGYGFQQYSETNPYTIRVLPNSGHLRVTVSPAQVTVDYVNAFLPGNGTNGQLAYTYTIAPPTTTPQVSFSPTSLSFGSQALNQSSAQRNVQLTNVGSAPLNIASIGPSNPPSDYSATNTCSSPLAAGMSCTITVTFTPTITGADKNTIIISDDAADSPQSISLTGTGISPAPAITSTNNTAFTVGVAGSFTVTATGSPTPTLSETGALPGGITFNAATGVLSGTPGTGAGGTYAITLTAHNGAGADAVQSFTLTVNVPILSASPPSQTVAAGDPASYTITNTGIVSYTLTCTSGLPTGATCGSVSVNANATASLVISTASRTSEAPPMRPNGRFHINPWGQALVALGISIVTLQVIRRRRVLTLALVSAFVLLFVLLAAGCGSSGSSGGGTTNPNGTPAGTYTITVTGTSGATMQSTTIALTVT